MADNELGLLIRADRKAECVVIQFNQPVNLIGLDRATALQLIQALTDQLELLDERYGHEANNLAEPNESGIEGLEGNVSIQSGCGPKDV